MERIGDDLYRISPLIRYAGSEVQGDAWTTRAHSAIAWGLLAVRTLTPYDASAILMHGIASRDWAVIGYLSRGILTADGDTWVALAEAASWFVFVGVGKGVAPLDADPFSLLLIRTLQYRIAAAGKQFDSARRVLAAFNTELRPGQSDEALRLARHFFLAQVLWRSEVPLSITDIVGIGSEYLTLSDSLSDVLGSGFREISHHVLQGPEGTFDAASVAGFTLSNRIDDRPGVSQLLDTCEMLPAATARRLLWFIGGTAAVATLMFSRAIVWENQQTQSDWPAVRDLALRAYARAREWELPGLAQAAAYWAAKIIDEHLEGRDEALRIADRFAAEIGWSPVQEDGRAATLLRAGQFAEALEIWRRILPTWRPESELDLQQQFSCRDAAIAAERLGEWGEAADWLVDARRRTGEGANPKYVAALLIDEGFARLEGRRLTGCFVALCRRHHGIGEVASGR
jgi:tetratricopeptide (TPR) repeat protein